MFTHRRTLLALSISLLSLSVACTPKASQATFGDLQDSVVANAVATSESDWHSSPATPEKIFAKWNGDLIQKKITSDEVCAGLAQVADKDLALFEEEIRAPRNAVLLSACLEQVTARLDNYWVSQRQILHTSTSNFFVDDGDNAFRFEDNVQYRDTNNGYLAVSADVAPKQVVLSFDDGPSADYTPVILKALEQVNAKAIFFEMGAHVRQFPEVSRMVAAGGHSMGGHSITHRCLAAKGICQHSNGGHMLTFAEATAEIAGSLQAIYNAVGWVDPFFRFPYGEYDPELSQYLTQNGIANFYWSIDSEDWKSKTPQAVIDDTMRQLNARGRGMILFHDIHHRTAEALPQFLKTLHDNGYQPVLIKPQSDLDRFNVRVVNQHQQ